jgi:tellurite resistance protein
MHAFPWLPRFPVALFAIPVGFFALGGAWRRAAQFGWTCAGPVGDGLAAFALAVLAVLLLIYLLKCLHHPQAVAAEFTHPLAASLTALIPLSCLLCIISYGVPGHPGWLLLTLATLALQGVIALRIAALIANAALPAEAYTPALYVPPLAGGLVGGMALQVLGYPGWAALLFGMGLASWALLEIRVLNRLFEGTTPEALRPTIGLELAPATVGTLAVATLWPRLSGELLIIGLGIATAPLVAVLARYRWWRQVPFGLGFWSFSFPAGAFAAVMVEVVHRGHWPAAVAGVALAVATAVIGYLALRTLRLLAQGRLIPAAPRQTPQP